MTQQIDTGLLVGILTFAGGILSLIITLVIAVLNIKGAQTEAADEISSGASDLLREYKEIRKQDKLTIEELSCRIAELEDWRNEINEFIIPVFEGAHRLKHQLLALDQTPVYEPPERPAWLERSIEKFAKQQSQKEK